MRERIAVADDRRADFARDIREGLTTRGQKTLPSELISFFSSFVKRERFFSFRSDLPGAGIWAKPRRRAQI